jgi:uncharacterized protein (DUF433 family)
MSTAPVIVEHVEFTPGHLGGEPRTRGTRIRVMDVVIWHEKQAMTPQQIVESYDGPTIADVHAALAYDHDHPEVIEADLEEEARRADQLRLERPPLGDPPLRRPARSARDDAPPRDSPGAH